MAAVGGSATATGGGTAGGGVVRVTAPLLVSADGIKSFVNRYRVISATSNENIEHRTSQRNGLLLASPEYLMPGHKTLTPRWPTSIVYASDVTLMPSIGAAHVERLERGSLRWCKGQYHA